MIVQLRDDEGNIIYIEASNDEDLPEDDVLRGQLTPEQRLEHLGESVASTCRTIIEQVRSDIADAMPDQLEVTFGVKLAGEVGLPVVAKSSAEATLTIRAVWTKSG